MGVLIPYKDAGVDTSPFTMVFQRVGIKAAILTSVLSAGNSGMYASSRMLHAMAKDDKAPAWLKKVNSRGVPVNALIATTVVASLCFLTGLYAEKTVYVWLVAATELAGFLREEYPQIPPKVEYSLSELGKSLIPILDMMCIWDGKNRL
ncbi:amino acid permease [Clostridium algifaecis]|uniref:Amino acid permease n=1 Tax=Clostridium algifaecis TaxID=1472040 RepID=A0ABS4KQC9_9CLOT|nr:amino acid permease [Clostridium algifaecis]